MPDLEPLDRYATKRLVDRLVPIVHRVPRLRRLVLRLPEDTRVRREVLTRAIVWSYQQFNATGRLPQQLWTSDFVLNQTATMLGTAETFHGRERSQDVITEPRRPSTMCVSIPKAF
jgi:hypothetical protein